MARQNGKAQPDRGLEIVYERLDSPAIRHLPDNAKEHDIGAIVGAIRKYGFIDPIGVNDLTDNDLDGNGRLLALRSMMATDRYSIPRGIRRAPDGMWLIPFVRGIAVPPADEPGAGLALNRTHDLGGYNQETLARVLSNLAAQDRLDGTGYDRDDVDAILRELRRNAPKPPAPPPAEATEKLRRKWKAASGQVWQIGAHKLLIGDSKLAETFARLLASERANLTVTSFPYAVGIDYGATYADDLASLRALLAHVPRRIYEYTTPGGYAVTVYMDIAAAKGLLGSDEVCEYPMALEYWPAFREAGWYLHTRRIWSKPHGRVVSPWCASSNRAASDWEHLYTWRKAGSGLNERREPSYLGVWDTSHGQAVEVGKDTFGAAMPAEIADRLIEVYTDPGAIVIDPFCGTGTTLVSCERTGRRGRAAEINPAIAAVSLERLASMNLRPELLSNR